MGDGDPSKPKKLRFIRSFLKLVGGGGIAPPHGTPSATFPAYIRFSTLGEFNYPLDRPPSTATELTDRKKSSMNISFSKSTTIAIPISRKSLNKGAKLAQYAKRTKTVGAKGTKL
jgi:hypothetical protein